ncbi:MAG: hypothetical protein U0894_05635 [Pirellulales bacterium]
MDFATAGEARNQRKIACRKGNVGLVGNVDQLFYAVGIGTRG